MANTFPSLVYPLEMKPENFYPEAMCFTIKKRIGVSLSDVEKLVEGAIGKTKDKIAKQNELQKEFDAKVAKVNGELPTQTVMDEALRDFNDASEKLGVIPAGMEIVNAGIGVVSGVIDKHRSELKKKGTTANNIGHIYLNMPQAITYDDSISWDGKALGAVGALMEGVGTGLAAGAVGAAGNIAGAGLGAMLSGLVSKVGLSNVGVGAFLGGMAGGDAQNALSATLGMTSNPYEEMMFSGITFRSFSFDFIFRPETDKEIVVVDKIIKAFRQYSRPSFAEGSVGKGIMNYPMEYEIEFLTADEGNKDFKGEAATDAASGEVYTRNKHLPRIKTCVCEKISTNYTPQSVWAAYNSGAPVAISLGLGFKEKELVMDKDVDEEGY